MAQPSVAQYFNNRKRAVIDEQKLASSRKVLILDRDVYSKPLEEKANPKNFILQVSASDRIKKIVQNQEELQKKNAGEAPLPAKKPGRSARPKKDTKSTNRDIQELFGNMAKTSERSATPPNVQPQQDKELDKIKKKICKSSRLAELRASINRFSEQDDKLQQVEKRIADLSQSPKLKSFKQIELEVHLSPQKVQSPEKAYLSPKKQDASVRRNLLNVLSPTKNAVALCPESPSKQILEASLKPGLTLPYKYRSLAEIFRAIDTVSQILHNRKEIITFKKLKSSVEEMLKRNLTEKHLGQIKTIYPEAYTLSREKLRQFGMGLKQEQWELVLVPTMDNAEQAMTSEVLLRRRRHLFNTLLNLVKDYHNEFLLALEPPMVIAKDKITRWHAEFDLEKVPDIEAALLPQPPTDQVFTTGKAVLEKARQMFNCNTRMEQALAKLEAQKAASAQTTESQSAPVEPSPPESLLKGIPKGLLEKVRQKQAAKALLSMTRSASQDKEIQMYARLPEIARLTRNIFVTEKKSVLPLNVVVEKLTNSYRSFLNKTELEEHLQVISKEMPTWLMFHTVRQAIFVKLAKNADVSVVLSKLEKLVKDKNES